MLQAFKYCHLTRCPCLVYLCATLCPKLKLFIGFINFFGDICIP